MSCVSPPPRRPLCNAAQQKWFRIIGQGLGWWPCFNGIPPVLRTLREARIASFELHGADLPERRMSPPGIVELLDVIEDVRASGVARCIRLAIHPLLFQRSEEALNRRIIPTVATPTHAVRDTFAQTASVESLCCRIGSCSAMNLSMSSPRVRRRSAMVGT